MTIIERPLRLASYRITRVGQDAVTDALERVERARPGMSASRRLSRGQAIGSVVVLALVVLALIVWPAGTMVVAVSPMLTFPPASKAVSRLSASWYTCLRTCIQKKSI